MDKMGRLMAPIFDNGRALRTDNSNIFSTCTLSGSFEEQIYGKSDGLCFLIKYIKNQCFDTTYNMC